MSAPWVAVATRFTHRAREPFTLDLGRVYEQARLWTKPSGLWLSVDGDWERWLADEGYLDDPDWGTITTSFAVDTDRCLWLRTVEDIDRFDIEYVGRNCVGTICGRPDRYRIDWAPLAHEYAGIIIAPYQWERRLGFCDASSWYYSWDAASACVWDLSAIEVPSLSAGAPATTHAARPDEAPDDRTMRAAGPVAGAGQPTGERT